MATVFEITQEILNRLFDDTLVPGLVLTEDVEFFKKPRADATNFDFGLGKPGETEPAGVSVRAPMVPYTQKQIQRSGGLIKIGDVQGYFQDSDIPLFEIGDKVEWLSQEYSAINVERHRMNETTLVWQVQLRN